MVWILLMSRYFVRMTFSIQYLPTRAAFKNVMLKVYEDFNINMELFFLNIIMFILSDKKLYYNQFTIYWKWKCSFT